MSNEKTGISVRKTGDSIHITFSSTLENIDVICETVTFFLRSRLKDIEKELFPINLVIREGLSNAVRHGNKNNPEKKVRFWLKIVDTSSIHLEIEDEGEGFDWKKQQDSFVSADEDHGRGMVIMGSYFKRYSYNDKGNILYLDKGLA